MEIIERESSIQHERYITSFKMETEEMAEKLAAAYRIHVANDTRGAGILINKGSVIKLDLPILKDDKHIVLADKLEEIIEKA